MSEEINITYKCERPKCITLATKTASPGVLGIMRKPPYPKAWKRINKKMLCPACSAEYTQLYAKLWKGFLEKPPTEKE